MAYNYYPKNNLRILTGVPLSPDYRHTYTFPSLDAQTTFFLGKTKYYQEDASYIRANGRINVNLPEKDLWNCSYLMWQNFDVSSKWFYAFITGLYYVSPEVTQIEFQLDIIQTFYFEFTFEPCFVEREHTNNDAIGANIVSEGIDYGPNIVSNVVQKYFTQWEIMGTYRKNEGLQAGTVDGFYYPMNYFVFSLENATSASAFIQQIITENGLDAMTGLWQIPRACWAPPETFDMDYFTEVIDGYRPKNKKLFTYPYCFILASNQDGGSKVLYTELFRDGNAEFEISGQAGPNAKLALTPLNYRGQARANDDIIFLDAAFPVPWAGTGFERWWSQNQMSYYTGLVGNALGASVGAEKIGEGISLASLGADGAIEGTGLEGNISQFNGTRRQATAGIMGGISQVYSGISSALNTAQNKKNAYDNSFVSSGAMAGNFRVKYGRYGFELKGMQITASMARRIDSYFSTFGYATREIKLPNITGRASWNYVQTIGGAVGGVAPSFAVKVMEACLNKGITFWHGDFLGDYSRDNSIVGVTG